MELAPIHELIGVPWVGFTHFLPDIGLSYLDAQSLEELIGRRPMYKEALKTCQGVILLSTRMKQWWVNYVSEDPFLRDFPKLRNALVVKHPVNFTEEVKMFNPSKIEQISRIVLLGQENRRLHTIYKVHPGPKYVKEWWPGVPEEEWPILVGRAGLSAKFEGETISASENASVRMMHTDDFSKYDNMLANSFIVIDCYDASANNALLEAIRTDTPVFVRDLPAHREYLGADYPLYFSTIDELGSLFRHEDSLHTKVRQAHRYIQQMNKDLLTMETFERRVANFLNNIKFEVGPPSEKTVCDWQCYLDNNPDLREAFGKNNVEAAEKHFKRKGYKEKRHCNCFKCNWQCYLDRYDDLTLAFGSLPDAEAKEAAKVHWENDGMKEGRNCECA